MMTKNHNNTPLFVDIILPLALPSTFTYSVPDALIDKAIPGKRVIVEFGKKKLYAGLIKNTHNNQPQSFKAKPIIDLLDESPILSPIHLAFWDWMSSYYMCTLGEIMKAAIPSGLRLESETLLFPNLNKESLHNAEKESLLYDWLLEQNKSTLEKTIQAGFPVQLINKLISKAYVLAEEKLIEGYKPKKETFVKLHSKYDNKEHFNTLFDTLSKAPRQLDLLLSYIKLSKIQQLDNALEISKKALLEEAKSSSQILQSLIQKQIFLSYEKLIDRLPSHDASLQEALALNDHQQIALDEIINQFSTCNTVLLHGITSSGKTEIYIQLIKEQLREKKQVLYLLPEIALTTQIITRLQAVFGDKVGVYHSKFSSSERAELWKKTGVAKQYQIVLGVRSSIFIPFDNLGLIIVDEEHETTYKQFDPAPRYHARDTAIYLASLHQAKVLLGTATPSIESYYNASTNKYGLVNITKRYKNIQLPAIELVDVYQARRKNLMTSHFSKRLLEEIRQSLDLKEQVILFQNRRGYSPFYQCETCGWIPYCTNCNVSLTYHKYQNGLECHYCGYRHAIYSQCEACKSTHMEAKGFGTEKIEDEVQQLFPSAVTKRLDLDTTRRKRAYEEIIGDFENGEIDILIGTQMVSKGLNFENVNLVGILNADNLLNFPDFRAFERSFQLLSQVSGRAGRSKKQGKVIIQTSMTDHDVLLDVLDNKFMSFYEKQIIERKNYHYPPFYKLVRLSIKAREEEITLQAAHFLFSLLRKKLGNRVLPPNAPLINKINKFHIQQILIKIEKDKSFQKAKDIILSCEQEVLMHKQFKSIIISSDVDPY